MIMEAVRTSKELVYFNETKWLCIPEDYIIFTLTAVRNWNLNYQLFLQKKMFSK
jgi:hypothetical protein